MAGAYPIGSIAGLIRISGAAQAQRDILGVQRSMTLTGETAGKAAAGIGRTETALGGVGTASTRAASGSAKFRAAQLSAVAASERYNTVLADESATLGRLASAEAGVIRANERMKASALGATAPVARLGAEAETSAGMMARAGTAVGGFARTAAGLGVALGGFALVKKAIDVTHEASDFNAAMVRIQTQAGATAGEIRGFSGDVLGLSGKVAQAPDQLATSLYHVYSATKALGYTGPQMLKAVQTAAEGATVSGADLEETTNALTATMVSGLGSVNNMGKAMGALNAIVGAGDMKLSDLNDALGTGILAAVKVYGVSLSQAGAALAVFGDNNIRGSDAATKLRMSIQDLSKPAATAAETLGRIGLTTTDLRDDLEKGGLSLALHHLKDSLEAAGITGDRVGGFLQDAFTKKAGVGLAILLNNIDQYDQKQTQITKGAGGFGAAWTATTQTASFAFKRLGAEAEAEGIILAQKLLPAASKAAAAIAGGLVAAIRTGHDVLVPLGGAAHFLAGSLVTVGHAAADVAHFLAPISPVLKFLATDVLATWAAFKGYQVARYAANAVADGIATVRARSVAGLASVRAYGVGVNATLTGSATEAQLTSRIMAAEFAAVAAAAEEEAVVVARAKAREAAAYADVVAASKAASDAQVAAAIEASAAAQAAATAAVVAAEETGAAAAAAAAAVDEAGAAAAVGWKALLGPAAAVGIGIALLTSLFGDNSDAAIDETQNIQDLTSAMEQDSSAVGTNTRAWLAHKLANSGILDQQKYLGLSYDTITRAVLGQGSALQQVAAAAKQAFSDRNFPAVAAANQIIGLSGALATAKARTREFDAAQVAMNQAHRDGAVAASRNSEAVSRLALGSVSEAHAAHVASMGMDGQSISAKKLADYLGQLTTKLQKFINTQLSQQQSQLAFKQGLLQLGQQVKDYGTSLSESTAKGVQNREGLISLLQTSEQAAEGSKNYGAALLANVKNFQAFADKAGYSKGRVDDLLRSLHLMPHQIETRLHLDTGPAQSTLVRLMNQINSLHPLIHVGIAGGHTLGLASGGSLPNGVSAVGERGPELAIKRGSSVAILSNSQSHRFLAASGMRAPGFADGTNPTGERATLNPRSLLRALGSASGERSALASLLNIGRRAGLGPDVLGELRQENKGLDAMIRERGRLSKDLDNANAKLVADEKKRHDELKTVRSAVTGSFDVTSAGVGPLGGAVTAGSMIAQERQAALRAKTFVSDIKKLSGKVGDAYLYQLAERGPDALPEVQALLSLSPKQLRGFRADEQSLAASGTALGTFIGRRRYGGVIAEDRDARNDARRALHQQTDAIKGAARLIVKQLEHAVEHLSDPKINVYLPGGKQLATAVQTGKNKNARKT